MDGVGAATVWRRADDLLTRRTTRSVLIMGPETDEPLKLEGAAAFVWDELHDPATDLALVTAIAARFALGADAVRADVVQARADLCRLGLLVGSDA